MQLVISLMSPFPSISFIRTMTSLLYSKMCSPASGTWRCLLNICWLTTDKFTGLRCISQEKIYLIFIFLSLFKYSCLYFPSTTLPHPTQPHLPPSFLPPVGFVRGSFIHVSWWPFPIFPLLFPSSHHSDYCQFVLYFSVSGYILLPCFVD